MKWQYHLIYMQSYFIPILIAAFRFRIKGGLGTAIVVSIIYLPHVMLHWGGLIEDNLLRFLQIGLFNIIGFLTGMLAKKEKEEKDRYQKVAVELKSSLDKLNRQSEKLSEMENQLRLADRLSVIGELTSSLAHEVRNPLGSIRGTVDILKEELPKEYRNKEFFSILIEETERLSNVVENYLGYAKRQNLQPIRYDANDIIQSSKTLLLNQAKKNGIDIIIKLSDSPVYLNGDPNELRQVIVNIILNAIQSISNEGKINIIGEILTQELPIQIHEKNDVEHKKWYRISIQDTGTGINPGELENIFKPFYTTKKSGTGLGLSIVKRIVDDNHWKLEVKSTVNEGTTFVLRVPFSNSYS
jgi:signal transduction histidine kinase